MTQMRRYLGSSKKGLIEVFFSFCEFTIDNLNISRRKKENWPAKNKNF
jgi:hypothetical protein